jgi:hypothetical protein
MNRDVTVVPIQIHTRLSRTDDCRDVVAAARADADPGLGQRVTYATRGCFKST